MGGVVGGWGFTWDVLALRRSAHALLDRALLAYRRGLTHNRAQMEGDNLLFWRTVTAGLSAEEMAKLREAMAREGVEMP